MAGAPGVPVAWLDGSAVTTYVVPSLVLVAVVGGTFLLAAVAVAAAIAFVLVVKRWRRSRASSPSEYVPRSGSSSIR